MKKIVFCVFSLLFLFAISFPAIAVQGTPSAVSNREEVRNEATSGAGVGTNQSLQEEAREELRENSQEKMATVQARLTERKREIVQSHFNRVFRRFTAAINRLNILIDRIESRLLKIEEVDNTLDTEKIKTEIESSKEKLNQAATTLENIKADMEQLIESETPKDVFTQVKNSIVQVREILIEVHQTLVKVIGDIKGLRVGETSTPSATME